VLLSLNAASAVNKHRDKVPMAEMKSRIYPTEHNHLILRCRRAHWE
jgi:hypothetical protein